MEELFRKNGVALLESIKISEIFLKIFFQEDVLANCDIESIGNAVGNSAKVSKLLGLLQTRPKGLDVLLLALHKTKQEGALKILDPSGARCKQLTTEVAAGTSQPEKTSEKSSTTKLIVGEKGCKVTKIVTLIQDGPVSHTFLAQENLSDFARRLDTPKQQRDKLFRDTLLDKKGLVEVLEEIIDGWASREGDDATLEILIEIMEQCKAIAVCGHLRRSFGLKKT